jgi:hypothetical protein
MQYSRNCVVQCPKIVITACAQAMCIQLTVLRYTVPRVSWPKECEALQHCRSHVHTTDCATLHIPSCIMAQGMQSITALPNPCAYNWLCYVIQSLVYHGPKNVKHYSNSEAMCIQLTVLRYTVPRVSWPKECKALHHGPTNVHTTHVKIKRNIHSIVAKLFS